MKAYRTAWMPDDTQAQYLLIDGHHIFRRTRYRFPSAVREGYKYSVGPWHRMTETKPSDLECFERGNVNLLFGVKTKR